MTLDDQLRAVFALRSIAVLGAKDAPYEAAFYVPDYLSRQGYRIQAVNPKLAGQHLWGQPAVATLADAAPADIIEIFRQPSFLPGHVEEILALPWRPQVVWFQLGIRHDHAAATLSAAGITVIQDRCMMPDHRRVR